jgi:hypothetical protein
MQAPVVSRHQLFVDQYCPASLCASQTGVVGCAAVDAYSIGRILFFLVRDDEKYKSNRYRGREQSVWGGGAGAGTDTARSCAAKQCDQNMTHTQSGVAAGGLEMQTHLWASLPSSSYILLLGSIDECCWVMSPKEPSENCSPTYS